MKYQSLAMLAVLVMLLSVVSGCATAVDNGQTEPTMLTRGSGTTTGTFVVQPFQLRFVDKDGQPMDNAEITYCPTADTDEECLAGTTDAQGYLQTNWEYTHALSMNFGVVHKNGYSVSCTVTPEDVKTGLTISPNGPVR